MSSLCGRHPPSRHVGFAGLFHAALSLAIVLYEGQRLSQALQSSIASMVTACVQKQLQDPASDRGTAPASSLVSGHQLAPTGQPACLMYSSSTCSRITGRQLSDPLFVHPCRLYLTVCHHCDARQACWHEALGFPPQYHKPSESAVMLLSTQVQSLA